MTAILLMLMCGMRRLPTGCMRGRFRAHRAFLVLRVLLVWMVFKVLRVLRVLQDLRVLKVMLVCRDLPVLRATLV